MGVPHSKIQGIVVAVFGICFAVLPIKYWLAYLTNGQMPLSKCLLFWEKFRWKGSRMMIIELYMNGSNGKELTIVKVEL